MPLKEADDFKMYKELSLRRVIDSSPVIARDEVPKQSQDRFGTGSAISKKDCHGRNDLAMTYG